MLPVGNSATHAHHVNLVANGNTHGNPHIAGYYICKSDEVMGDFKAFWNGEEWFFPAKKYGITVSIWKEIVK